jgi:D-glycero-alpha-D-manno-heptose-7-phosphate kinase
MLANKISNKEIDKMYNDAMNAGALGGKVLGAGGGGFLLMYVPKENQKDVKEALSDYKLVDFSFDSFGTQIIFKN